MKGARLCAQVFSVTRTPELRDAAAQAVRYVSHRQAASGGWPYAIGDTRGWSDNFHTGYILDCLDEYERCTADESHHAVLERGWAYYRDRFLSDDGKPKYYEDRLYPIDANACAQTIMTLTRFGDLATAIGVAGWTITHMQRDDGAFRYRIYRSYTNSIPYIRWSTSAMFCALAFLLDAIHEASGEPADS